MPEIETFPRGDALVMRADLPGIEKADITVEIDNGVLSISGERRGDHTTDRGRFIVASGATDSSIVR